MYPLLFASYPIPDMTHVLSGTLNLNQSIILPVTLCNISYNDGVVQASFSINVVSLNACKYAVMMLQTVS